MKINSTFHVLIFLMAVLIFSMPFVSFSQQNSVQVETETAAPQDAFTMSLEAKAAAERDASINFNQPLWCLGGGAIVTLAGVSGAALGFGVGQAIDPAQGCELISTGMIVGCIGGWGIGLSAPLYAIYKYRGTVPSERLIGKSPEYVEIYTKVYRQKIGLLRTTRAAAGAALIHLGVYAIGLLTSE